MHVSISFISAHKYFIKSLVFIVFCLLLTIFSLQNDQTVYQFYFSVFLLFSLLLLLDSKYELFIDFDNVCGAFVTVLVCVLCVRDVSVNVWIEWK